MFEMILKFLGGIYIGILFVMPITVIMMICVLVRMKKRIDILELKILRETEPLM